MCVSGVQYGGFWENTCIANFINRTIVLVNVITFKWQNKAEAKKKNKTKGYISSNKNTKTSLRFYFISQNFLENVRGQIRSRLLNILQSASIH